MDWGCRPADCMPRRGPSSRTGRARTGDWSRPSRQLRAAAMLHDANSSPLPYPRVPIKVGTVYDAGALAWWWRSMAEMGGSSNCGGNLSVFAVLGSRLSDCICA